MEWYYWVVLIVIVVGVYRHLTTKWRRESLMEKYSNNKELVELIMSRSFWQGQTEGQLIDSLGKPLDVDQKVLKTKTKEIWKYNQRGKNRYGLKVTLENGEVVGWDQK